MTDPSILRHKDICDEIDAANRLQVEEVQRRIAGHLMIIRKGVWKIIRRTAMLQVVAYNKKILGVDTKISYAMLQHGFKIYLMKGIYILHYLRMKEGFDYKNHLL